MMRPVGNSYLVQEGFFPIHKESVGNLVIEPHSDGLLTISHDSLTMMLMTAKIMTLGPTKHLIYL